MNYEIKSSIRRVKISLSIKVLICIVFILLILYIFAPNFLSSIFTAIVRPFWTFGVGKKPSINSLSVGTQNSIISELKKENEELKQILNRSTLKNSTLAYVLKKPPFTGYDSFILDIGTDNSIKKGNKVYTISDILIGEIAEVFSNTSRVKLYSSYGEKYNILIGEENIENTAIGRGSGSFETIVPRDIKIKEGDTIKIPNISNSVFGIVNKIIADPARAFSTVIFSQPLNIYEQKWVLIESKEYVK